MKNKVLKSNRIIVQQFRFEIYFRWKSDSRYLSLEYVLNKENIKEYDWERFGTICKSNKKFSWAWGDCVMIGDTLAKAKGELEKICVQSAAKDLLKITWI